MLSLESPDPLADQEINIDFTVEKMKIFILRLEMPKV